jgi:hypothetical protein
MLSIFGGVVSMRGISAVGLAAASVLALAACTGGGGNQSPSPTGTTTTTTAAAAKVYSEDQLRDLIAGMKDGEGNELKLYSQDQVNKGGNIANLLLSAATVDPADCKSIATAGLLDKVEKGNVAVAISEGSQPRTLSAQSGSDGPDAVAVLKDVASKMDKCATFSVEALGQRYEVTSKELTAKTNAEQTFATLSTRGQNQKLMQVSAAEGRLLVVATKGGTDLGDDDQKELEGLVNGVLAKAEGGTASSSPTGTSMSTSNGSANPTDSASPTATETEDGMTSSPAATPTATSSTMP